MTLPELRAINNAKINTLRKVNPTGADLLRCQIVARILEDEHCFAKMSRQEAVDVLTTIGFSAESAAKNVKLSIIDKNY